MGRTVRSAVGGLLLAKKAEGAKLATQIWYHHRLRSFVMRYGDWDIESVTLEDVREYMASVHESEYSEYTKYTLIRVVRHLFKWLYDERQISDNFWRRIKVPRLPQPMPKAIDLTDVEALLSTCDGSPLGLRDRAILLFLLDTGCRVGGLCSLRIGDVDLEHKRAYVREKGGRARLVMFGEETASALVASLGDRVLVDGEPLFLCVRGSRGIVPNTVIQMLRRRGRRANVKGRVNPHAFRHAFAREWLLSGGDLASASELMGHGGLNVTREFYARFVTEELRDKHAKYSPVAQLRNRRA